MKISVRNLQKKIPINPKRIRKAVLKAVCAGKTAKKSGEITICFVNDPTIRQINLMYCGKEVPTDVLAFDIAEGKHKKVLLADVVISTDTAIRNAKTFKTSAEFELYLYVVHGILHLLGYDDKTAKDRNAMLKKALAVLNELKFDQRLAVGI